MVGGLDIEAAVAFGASEPLKIETVQLEGPKAGEVLVRSDPQVCATRKEQLYPNVFEEACMQARQPLTLRWREGYDHDYYFISRFVED